MPKAADVFKMYLEEGEFYEFEIFKVEPEKNTFPAEPGKKKASEFQLKFTMTTTELFGDKAEPQELAHWTSNYVPEPGFDFHADSKLGKMAKYWGIEEELKAELGGFFIETDDECRKLEAVFGNKTAEGLIAFVKSKKGNMVAKIANWRAIKAAKNGVKKEAVKPEVKVETKVEATKPVETQPAAPEVKPAEAPAKKKLEPNF